MRFLKLVMILGLAGEAKAQASAVMDFPCDEGLRWSEPDASIGAPDALYRTLEVLAFLQGGASAHFAQGLLSRNYAEAALIWTARVRRACAEGPAGINLRDAAMLATLELVAE